MRSIIWAYSDLETASARSAAGAFVSAGGASGHSLRGMVSTSGSFSPGPSLAFPAEPPESSPGPGSAGTVGWEGAAGSAGTVGWEGAAGSAVVVGEGSLLGAGAALSPDVLAISGDVSGVDGAGLGAVGSLASGASVDVAAAPVGSLVVDASPEGIPTWLGTAGASADMSPPGLSSLEQAHDKPTIKHPAPSIFMMW